MSSLERERVKASVRGRLFGEDADPPRVGPYEIRGRLGSGAMGVVYEAWDPRLRRAVALKMLRTDASDSQHAQRLIREAQALAQLRHPNVVAVHDVGTEDEQVYVVMELIAGETLTRWVERKKPAVSELLSVLAQVGRGLQAAHESGLVHRDVKPDNVLVSQDGTPHLLDFGLVRQADEKAAASMRRRLSGPLNVALTQVGTLLGTPVYMSPEQLEGKSADEQSDQYAFAVSSYHLLYGELPFAHDSLDALIAAVRGGEIRKAKSVGEPTRVRNALFRALDRDPGRRFDSMKELLGELEPSAPPKGGRGPLFLALALGGIGLVAGLFIASRSSPEKNQPVSQDTAALRRDTGTEQPRDAGSKGNPTLIDAGAKEKDAGPKRVDAAPERPPDAGAKVTRRPKPRAPRRSARVGSNQNLWRNSEPMEKAARPLHGRMSRCFPADWTYEGGKSLLGVYLKVEADGRVSNVRVEQESYVPAQIKKCLRGVYRRIKKFPPTKRGYGGEVWYVIPFRPDSP